MKIYQGFTDRNKDRNRQIYQCSIDSSKRSRSREISKNIDGLNITINQLRPIDNYRIPVTQ